MRSATSSVTPHVTPTKSFFFSIGDMLNVDVLLVLDLPGMLAIVVHMLALLEELQATMLARPIDTGRVVKFGPAGWASQRPSETVFSMRCPFCDMV